MQFLTGNTQSLQNINLSDVLQDLLIVLNERENKVLIRRFAIGNTQKETLESIGQDLTVTRERVRQIENMAIKKLRRTCPTTAFHLVNKLTDQILKDNGGILTEETLVSLILQELPNTTPTEASIIQLSLEINPNIKRIKKSKNNHNSWHIDSLQINNIKTIITTAIDILNAHKDTILENEFIKQTQRQLAKDKLSVNPKTIQSALSIDSRIKLIPEGYGLTTWRHVQPKSIRDKALIILRRHNKPLHFIEIANQISSANFSKKQVTTQAVHNELIRYEDFVLVGRGLYALKEWGYSKGTVKEVLSDILKETSPLKKQDIIKAVLKRRHVKVGTISLNLQKYPEFERVGRALYQYNATLI